MSQEILLQEMAEAAQKKQFAVLQQLADNYCALHPMDATGYYYSAVCHKQRSDYEAAQKSANQALALDDQNTEALFLAAAVAMELGQTDKAGEIYTQLANNPELANAPDVHIALSVFHIRHDSPAQALEAAQKACQIAPQSAAALLQRAQAHQVLRDYDAAQADITAAIAAEPNSPEPLRAHILFCSVFGSPQDAIPSFATLLEAEPRNIGLQADYARLLIGAKDYAKAENALDTLLQYDEENTEYRLWRAQCRLEQNNPEGAVSDCRSVITLAPADARAYIVAANAYLALYDAEEALAILGQAVDNDVTDLSDIYRLRGQIYMQEYDFVRAADEFQLLALDPAYSGEGYLMLGKAYKEQGDLDEAFVVWQMAEEAAVYEATDLIEEFCQAQLAAAAKGSEAQFIADYAAAAEENAKSKLIDALSKKYWRFDDKATIAKNPDVFKELPEEMRSGILEAFGKMVFMVRPKGLLILNPDQTDFRAVYKITEDKGAKLTLAVQPLNGLNLRTFKLAVNGKTLMLDGLAEELEFDICFGPADALKPNEETALKQRKAAGEIDFLD